MNKVAMGLIGTGIGGSLLATAGILVGSVKPEAGLVVDTVMVGLATGGIVVDHLFPDSVAPAQQQSPSETT